MSSTKSPSRTGQATDLILVAHGSPSDPAPQEAFIKGLAAEVAALSGCAVRGATLAAEGSLEAAVDGLDCPMVFPHFMADGWFVSTNLPRRLTKAGLQDWTMLQPLGLHPDLPAFALKTIIESVAFQIYPQARPALVIAAHGSPSDPRPKRATDAFAAKMAASDRFTNVSVGFVDEAPTLAEALEGVENAIVLPFFAAQAGHVLMDLPEAIEAAAYTGAVMPPIGTWQETPALIARAIMAHQKERAA